MLAKAVNRSELFARMRGGLPAIRPPGAVVEALFVDRCTRCDACAAACPERIVVRGAGGFPVLDVRQAGCTFCGACAAACEMDCFERGAPAPLGAVAAVAPSCLEAHGVACRLCETACEADAIRFRPQPGGRAQVVIRAQDCTGCGACVAPCPVDALSLVPHRRAPAPPAAASVEVRP